MLKQPIQISLPKWLNSRLNCPCAHTLPLCNTDWSLNDLLQLLSCIRALLLLLRPPPPHHKRSLADLKRETMWSITRMARPVYWHQWVSSSTSPSALSPRIRCLNVNTLHKSEDWRAWNDFEIVNVLLSIYRLCRRSWTSSPIWQRALDHVRLTRPPCCSQQMQRRPTSPSSSHWWVPLSPLNAPSITTITLCHLCRCRYYYDVLPTLATRWQLAVTCFPFWVTDFWRSYCFSQNTTSNKYHLSEVSLSADWPALKGKSILPAALP